MAAEPQAPRSSGGHRVNAMALKEAVVASLRQAKPKLPTRHKIMNDPVHGHIRVHPLLIAVMDTPQFQRLRDLKQVGGVYLVFPGAAHNRFEHCVGVSYLAARLMEELIKHQPDLGITEAESLCVQVAGLCHDLGHGPMSHMFDRHFVPLTRGPDCDWEHEAASAAMLDRLIAVNDHVKALFEKFGLTSRHVHFIKELIFGSVKEAPSGWEWAGWEKDKEFLFDIIANKRNGIDLDKLGMKWSFDANRLMQFTRAVKVDGEMQLCFHEKEVWNLYELFHTRYNLHKRAYQHRVARICEDMLTEAMVLANDHVTLPGTDGVPTRMSDAIHDMAAYECLTDSVLWGILVSTSPELQHARALLKRIKSRQLYPFVAEALLPSTTPKLSQEELDGIKRRISELTGNKVAHVNLILHRVTLNYGLGTDNPIDKVRFYSRQHGPPHDTAGAAARASGSCAVSCRDMVPTDRYIAAPIRRERVSCFIPTVFQEQYLRLYCRLDQDVGTARAAFDAWCEATHTPASPFKRPAPPVESTLDTSRSDGLPVRRMKRRLDLAARAGTAVATAGMKPGKS